MPLEKIFHKKQEISNLEIPMENTFVVAVAHSINQLLEELPALSF